MLGASATPAAAKSFGLEQVQTDAVVRPDGSMTVTEQVTYHFDGTFNHLTRSFASGAITGLQATEGERALAVESSGPPLWQWAIPETSGIHTYTFSYTVLDAVRVGSDVGELNWQFIGTDTAVPIDHVDIAITMPGDGTGLRAWAHGPLNGEVVVTANRVDLMVDHLPAHTFVEAHVVVPATNFTTAATVPGAILPGILSSEQRDAEEANAARAAARDRLARRHDLQMATPFALAAGLIAFLAIWMVWGREPRRPDDVGDYWRELPEDRPAVGRCLLDFGDVGSTAFSATVVDLAQRGYLRITEERTDRLIGKDKVTYRFDNLRHEDADGLTGWERALLQQLFDGVESTTQDELTARSRAKQSESQLFWASFRADIKGEVTSAGYLLTHRPVPYLLTFALLAGLVAFGIITMGAGSPWGATALVLAAGLFLFIRTLRRRSADGARRSAEWAGLRNFLKDFSRLDEAVSGDLIIYERYLVAAVALGVADELIAGLTTRFPEVAANPGFARLVRGQLARSLDHGPGLRRARDVRLVLRRHHRRLHPAIEQQRLRRRLLRGWRGWRGWRRLRRQLMPRSTGATDEPDLDLTGTPPEELPERLADLYATTPVASITTLRLPMPATGLGVPVADLVVGAGFSVTQPAVIQIRRERSLPDRVGPGMRLLVCGLNPSLYAADAGLGFARPGNRFWPAALAAGLVSVDRDPGHALAVHGMGMTDLVKRATARADELTTEEYRRGLGRVTRLVGWLRPRAVCFVGLAGWRVAVDRRAVAGVQPEGVAGTEVYVMPSTSGLNAHQSVEDLTAHLRAALALAGHP